MPAPLTTTLLALAGFAAAFDQAVVCAVIAALALMWEVLAFVAVGRGDEDAA